MSNLNQWLEKFPNLKVEMDFWEVLQTIEYHQNYLVFREYLKTALELSFIIKLI